MCVGVSVFRGAQVCLNLNLHLSLIGLSQVFPGLSLLLTS